MQGYIAEEQVHDIVQQIIRSAGVEARSDGVATLHARAEVAGK